ncbi:hypothetical protein SPSYN_00923 [Sporotomaculum syntrophicum]|uniref:Uncharacterized protein n=1 Tax=Sporotomaculum syntrophicum TaxID=182264 RepID=A0A9D2WT72_9FIRM|nr:hypothetical protein SPSYN_00923 [Sporotomaculum syntrophicum]
MGLVFEICLDCDKGCKDCDIESATIVLNKWDTDNGLVYAGKTISSSEAMQLGGHITNIRIPYIFERIKALLAVRCRVIFILFTV